MQAKRIQSEWEWMEAPEANKPIRVFGLMDPNTLLY